MNCKRIFIIFIIFLSSCTTNDHLNFNKKNIQVDVIQRSSEDIYFADTEKKNKILLSSLEEENLGIFKITKDFFRCKGNPLNPVRKDEKNPSGIKIFTDCEGPTKHSLSLINSQEGVYPVLIEILNYIQKKTNKKVVITCGYRCPKHNVYADILNNAKESKHMLGAEVDFYVQGFEQSPDKVVDIILQFYNENAKYKGRQEFEIFKRFEEPTDISTQPWFNKEILIKLYQSNEGRDFDNRHPYPYVSIEVLWDKNSKQMINFSLDKANKGYLQ